MVLICLTLLPCIKKNEGPSPLDNDLFNFLQLDSLRCDKIFHSHLKCEVKKPKGKKKDTQVI